MKNNNVTKLILKNHLLSLLICYLLVNIVSIIEYKSIVYLIPISITLLLCVLLYKNIKNNKIISKEKNVIKNKFDIYSRKYYLCFIILFLYLLGYSSNCINLYFNSKSNDIVSYLLQGIDSLMIVLYFLIKNKLQLISFNNGDKNNKLLSEQIRKMVIIFSIYLLITIIFVYLFEVIFVLNPLPFFYILFIVITYITFNKVINNYLYVKRKNNKWEYVIILIIFICVFIYYNFAKNVWLLQPYINSIPNINTNNNSITYNEENGIYTIVNNKDDFKILQLTDIHLGGSALSYDKDLKALKTVYNLIEYTNPDLVIVTGDLTYPVGLSSFSINNSAPVMEFSAFMRNLGIPWVFTYGNHDTESMAIIGENEIEELYKSLSYKTSKNLLYPYVEPGITGRNNQIIEIRNKDNSINQLLYLLDSNDYMSSGFSDYDYIHDDQVTWYEETLNKYKEENSSVSSLMFFHIPTKEYQVAYDLYKEGSNEVKYFFGENGEEINSSKYDSKLFDKVVELGSTKAIFCGHDHYNNISLEYKGIRLTYGMSIDYLVEPGIARKDSQRGATLITSHKDSSIDIEQIPYKDIS